LLILKGGVLNKHVMHSYFMLVYGLVLGLRCLMPLWTIFQLYRRCQCYW